MIEVEVYQALHLMKFTIYRTGGWNRRIPQFLIALMQFIAALSTEGINMILICTETEIDQVIMNLLAFGIIAEIDDLYANSLKCSFPMYLVKEAKLDFSIPVDEKTNPLEINKAVMSKIIIKVW